MIFDREYLKNRFLSGNIVIKLLVGFVVLIFVALFGYRYYLYNFSHALKENSTENSLSTPLIKTQPSQYILYTSFPNFDALKIEDLPKFTDVRNVFDYNGNKLVIGYDQIVELDQSNNIVRTSLRSGADFSSAAKIGDLLYLSDNGEFPFTPESQPKIYVMDLKTGALTNTMQGLNEIQYDLVNTSLASHNNDLWLATRTNVIRYDTVENKVIKAYELKDLGYTATPTCDNAVHFTGEGDSIQVVEFACKNFISTYNYETDAWDYKKYDKIDPSKYINRNANDFGIKFPIFVALSLKVNNKYFALAPDGIYEVEQTSLPKSFYNKEIVGIFPTGANYIYTQDGITFLVFSFTDLQGPIPGDYINTLKLTDSMTVKTINTSNNVEKDLVAESDYANDTLENLFVEGKLLNIYQAAPVVENGVFKLILPQGGSIDINLTTQKLLFNF